MAQIENSQTNRSSREPQIQEFQPKEAEIFSRAASIIVPKGSTVELEYTRKGENYSNSFGFTDPTTTASYDKRIGYLGLDNSKKYNDADAYVIGQYKNFDGTINVKINGKSYSLNSTQTATKAKEPEVEPEKKEVVLPKLQLDSIVPDKTKDLILPKLTKKESADRPESKLEQKPESTEKSTQPQTEKTINTSPVSAFPVSPDQTKYYSEVAKIQVPKGTEVQVYYRTQTSSDTFGPLDASAASTAKPGVGYLGRSQNASSPDKDAYIVGNYQQSGAEFFIKAGDKFYNMQGQEVPDIKQKVEKANSFTNFVKSRSTITPNETLVDASIPDFSGKEHKLSELVKKGNLTLIDFWADWCNPCREGMPKVVQTVKENANETFKYSNGDLAGKGLKFASILTSANSKDPQNILKKIGVKNSDGIHLDAREQGDEIAARYGVSSLPTSILVDGQGQVIARFDQNSGASIEQQLKDTLDKLR